MSPKARAALLLTTSVAAAGLLIVLDELVSAETEAWLKHIVLAVWFIPFTYLSASGHWCGCLGRKRCSTGRASVID